MRELGEWDAGNRALKGAGVQREGGCGWIDRHLRQTRGAYYAQSDGVSDK